MRTPLFCDTAPAALIERVETEMIALLGAAARPRDATVFAIPIAGGVASVAEPGSRFNKVAGLDFAGVPSEAALTAIEAAFAARRRDPAEWRRRARGVARRGGRCRHAPRHPGRAVTRRVPGARPSSGRARPLGGRCHTLRRAPRRRARRRLRCRRRHHPARVLVPAERPAPWLRPAVHPRHPHAAAGLRSLVV